jgi:hypothetical protein
LLNNTVDECDTSFFDINLIHFWISMWYVSGYQYDTFLDINVIDFSISM